MGIYILNLILILVYGILYRYLKLGGRLIIVPNGINLSNDRNVNLKVVLCSIIGVQLFLISALRYNIGTDDKTYKRMFLEIAGIKNFFSYPIEKGFGAINWVIGQFTHNYQWMLAVMALLTILCVSVAVYRYAKYPVLTFFLYVTMSFYYSSMCLIRHGLAIAISFLGLKYIKEKCLWKYLVIVLLAALIHYSALTMLPIYFIANIDFNVKQMFSLSALILLIYLFVDKIFLTLATVIPKYKDVYVSQEGIDNYLQGMSWKSMIVCVLVFILMMIFKKQLLSMSRENLIFINISFFAVLISLFQTKVNVLDRMAYYFNSYMIFSLPLLVDCFDKTFVLDKLELISGRLPSLQKVVSKWDDKAFSYIMLGIIMFAALLYNIYVFVSGYYSVVPYKSILFK